MDRPKRQTATATPAKPGGLPLTLASRAGGPAGQPGLPYLRGGTKKLFDAKAIEALVPLHGDYDFLSEGLG